MATVKQCDDPRCGRIDDGKRPIKVGDTIITIQRNGDPLQFSAELCDACFHDLFILLSPRLPNLKDKWGKRDE